MEEQKEEDKEAVEEKERFVVVVGADVGSALGLFESMPSEGLQLSGADAVSCVNGNEVAAPARNAAGFGHKGPPNSSNKACACNGGSKYAWALMEDWPTWQGPDVF